MFSVKFFTFKKDNCNIITALSSLGEHIIVCLEAKGYKIIRYACKLARMDICGHELIWQGRVKILGRLDGGENQSILHSLNEGGGL